MKQTLKIGEQYRLKKDVLWYEAGTIFERDNEGQTYITELDGNRYRTLDALQLAICDHRNEEGSEEYFELIKSKTKKVKKWKYSREEIELWMQGYETYFPKQILESYKKLREQLLATKPKPIKEEKIPIFKDMPSWNKCADKVESLVKPKQEENKSMKALKALKKSIDNGVWENKEESKDIEKIAEEQFRGFHQTDSRNIYDLWQKQCEVIDTLNSLTKRK